MYLTSTGSREEYAPQSQAKTLQVDVELQDSMFFTSE